MESEILKVIAAGGDLSGWAIVYFMYHLHSRLLKIEVKQENCCG